MQTLEMITKSLKNKLHDGTISSCRDFIDYCELKSIVWNDELFKLFYKTKRIYLSEKKKPKH